MCETEREREREREKGGGGVRERLKDTERETDIQRKSVR